MLEEDGFRKADPSILPAGIAGRPDHCEQLYRHTPAAVANRCREDGYRDAVPSMPRYCPATTLPHDQLVCRFSTLQICMCPFTFLSPGVTFTICILNFVNAMRWQTSTIHKVNALLQHFKLLRPICKQVHPRYFGPKRTRCDRNQFLTFEFVRLELWHWDRCRGIALPHGCRYAEGGSARHHDRLRSVAFRSGISRRGNGRLFLSGACNLDKESAMTFAIPGM